MKYILVHNTRDVYITKKLRDYKMKLNTKTSAFSLFNFSIGAKAGKLECVIGPSRLLFFESWVRNAKNKRRVETLNMKKGFGSVFQR